MRAAVLGVLATGCVYVSPSVGAVRASQTTTGDRGAPYLYVSGGFRSTSDARVRCGGGVGFLLTGNSYGNAYGAGPEARCNVAVADAGRDRRWAVFARVLVGAGWLDDPETNQELADGTAVVGFAGVAYEMLSAKEWSAGEDRRPTGLDLALGVTAARLDVDGEHFSWIGLGIEASGGFHLPYYLDRTGRPH